MSERTARVFSWVAAAAAGGAGDGRISLAALCRAAPARLGADGASVTAMTSRGVPAPVAASGELAAELEELQFTLGEGPCVAAFGFASPMLIPDLAAAATRWPGFAAAACERGVGAVFAFPLHAGAIRLGVFELYRTAVGPLETEALADALVFADLALQLLLDGPSGLVENPAYYPIDGVSSGRDVVHQATGMIAVQLGVGVAEALARLRAHTFTGTASLHEVAADVVARRLRFQPDTDPDPEPDVVP